MLHRRLNCSDSQGPFPLNDTSRISARLWLAAGAAADVEAVRPVGISMLNHPWGLFSAPVSIAAWTAAGWAPSLAPLAAAPPFNVALLTLQVCARGRGAGVCGR